MRPWWAASEVTREGFVLRTVAELPGLWEQQANVYMYSGQDGSRAISFLTGGLSLPSVLFLLSVENVNTISTKPAGYLQPEPVRPVVTQPPSL